MKISFFLIVLLAGITHGLTGFGAGIICVLILSSFLTLPESAGISAVIGTFLSCVMTYQYRKSIQIKEVILPTVVFVIFSAVSINLSLRVNQSLARGYFGLFLILISLYSLFLSKKINPGRISKVAGVCVIALAGFCDGLFSASGPLMVLYFLSRLESMDEYMANSQCFFALAGVGVTVVRICNGILLVSHIKYCAIGIIAILTGLFIARKITGLLNADTIRKIIYVLIGILGIYYATNLL